MQLRRVFILAHWTTFLYGSSAYNPELSCAELIENGLSWNAVRGRLSTVVRSPKVHALATLHNQAGSRCPIGHLTIAWWHLAEQFASRARYAIDGRGRSQILEKLVRLHHALKDKLVLSDVFWSSWPLFAALARIATLQGNFTSSKPQQAMKRRRLAVKIRTPVSRHTVDRLNDFLKLVESDFSWLGEPSTILSHLAIPGSASLLAELDRLQRSMANSMNIQNCIGHGHSRQRMPDSSDYYLCPACRVRIQMEWTSEVYHIDHLWDLAHKQVFLRRSAILDSVGETPRKLAALGLAAHPLISWPQKLTNLRNLMRNPAAADRRAKGWLMRHNVAVATVLWSTSGSHDELWIYAEAVRTLAHQVRKIMWRRVPSRNAPFLVLSPADLPRSIAHFVKRGRLARIYRIKGLTVLRPGITHILPGRVGPVYDWPKFMLWRLTQFDAIIYLDADVLPWSRESLDGLFNAMLQGRPRVAFAAVGFGHENELNNGVFVLRPSKRIHRCLMAHAINGTFWQDPGFFQRGHTWQAYLDLFWQSFSPRISKGQAVQPQQRLGCQGTALPPHLVLPRQFNFPASFSSAVGGARLTSEVASAWADDIEVGPIHLVHWVGASRKPWAHWTPAVQTVFDRRWWQAHSNMCASAAAQSTCRLKCVPR